MNVSRKSISPSLLNQLNRGECSTTHLVEIMAIDFSLLIQTLRREKPLPQEEKEFFKNGPFLQRMEKAAHQLCLDRVPLDQLTQHPSDTVRGWAAYRVANDRHSDFRQKLERISPLANDNHFAVREWAWIALRPFVIQSLQEALTLLQEWTPQSAYSRRFACEITRPRGVWCSSIPLLKENPSLGLPLLSPLRNDPSRYVQNSVGNWLNDASRTQPQWVREICQSWLEKSPTPSTHFICKRSLRTLDRPAP